MYNIPHLLGLFSQYIPNIVEAALERLTRESKTPELRTMCLQVVSTFKILHPCTITYFTLSPTSVHCLLLFLWPPFSFLPLSSLVLFLLSVFSLPLLHSPQVIAVLYYNPSMLLGLLEKTHFPDSTEAITTQFFSQWIKDADLFTG